MGIKDRFLVGSTAQMVLELYNVGLVVIGIGLFGVAVLPRFVSDRAISLPIFFVAFGMLVFGLPIGLPAPDPSSRGRRRSTSRNWVSSSP